MRRTAIVGSLTIYGHSTVSVRQGPAAECRGTPSEGVTRRGGGPWQQGAALRAPLSSSAVRFKFIHHITAPRCYFYLLVPTGVTVISELYTWSSLSDAAVVLALHLHPLLSFSLPPYRLLIPILRIPASQLELYPNFYRSSAAAVTTYHQVSNDTQCCYQLRRGMVDMPFPQHNFHIVSLCGSR